MNRFDISATEQDQKRRNGFVPANAEGSGHKEGPVFEEEVELDHLSGTELLLIRSVHKVTVTEKSLKFHGLHFSVNFFNFVDFFIHLNYYLSHNFYLCIVIHSDFI